MRKRPFAWLAVCLLVAGGTPATGWADTLPDVPAQIETPALFDDDDGGNADADDPAIWYDEDDPGRSLVIATAKNGGLYAYRLSGESVQHVPAPAAPGPEHESGRFNNVDVLQDVKVGSSDDLDLAIASDRGRDQLRIYAIDEDAPKRPLADITAEDVPFVFSGNQDEVDEQHTAYGLSAWHDEKSGATYVLVSQRSATRLALLQLTERRGKIGYRVVRTLDLPAVFGLPNGTQWQPCGEPGELPQVEGMVVDVQRGVLFAGQEDVGIWRMSARLDDRPVLVDRVREFGVPGYYNPETEECVPAANPGFGGKHVSADVEGLTIYYGRNGNGYLLASSQGDNTFAVYQRDGRNDYVGSFRVGAGKKYDGSEESDGAAVTNVGLGGGFPRGLLVVQDGDNTPSVPGSAGEPRGNTNFKFVRWDTVAGSLATPLTVDPTGYKPTR